jgi:hypothetical protein
MLIVMFSLTEGLGNWPSDPALFARSEGYSFHRYCLPVKLGCVRTSTLVAAGYVTDFC